MSQEMELEVLSPLHIGGPDGADLVSEELVFENDTAHIVDIDSYFDDNPDEIDDFVREVEKGGDVSDFFSVDVAEEYAKYSLRKPTDVSVRGEVLGFVKDGMGNPYVPGSSIKGCIRTALATFAVDLSGDREWMGQSSRDAHQILERNIFRLGEDDPKKDMMKCVSVRDAEITDGEGLYLTGMKTYSEKGRGNMESKHWTTHAEFLAPGTRLKTEVSVDTDLLSAMIDEGPDGSDGKARTVFGGDLADEAEIVDTIKDSLRMFASDVVDRDEEILRRGGELPSKFEAIDEFHSELRERNEDGYALRMGFSTGWHSNTVGTALSNEEVSRLQSEHRLGKKAIEHKGCGGDVKEDDYNEGKFFCHSCKEGGLDEEEVEFLPFPKTRNYVRQRGRPRYPLGWVVGV